MSKIKRSAAGLLVVGAIVLASPTNAMAADTGWVTGGSCAPDSTNVISSFASSSGFVRHDWHYSSGMTYISWPSGGSHYNDTNLRTITSYGVATLNGTIYSYGRNCD